MPAEVVKLKMMILGQRDHFKPHQEVIIFGDKHGKTIISWLAIHLFHTSLIRNQQQ